MNNTLPPPLRTAVLLYWKLNPVGGELTQLWVPRDRGLWLTSRDGCAGTAVPIPLQLWRTFSAGQGSLQGAQSPSGIALVLVGWVRGPWHEAAAIQSCLGHQLLHAAPVCTAWSCDWMVPLHFLAAFLFGYFWENHVTISCQNEKLLNMSH